MTALERVVLRVAVFLGGAMLMAIEISAFRMIGKTFGSALRETTAVIAVFLAAMSLGYWVGGRAGDRWPRTATLVAAFLSAAASLLLVPYLDALVSPRIAVSGLYFAIHAFLATSVLFAIPTFFFASVSPIAVRLFAPRTSESGSTTGSLAAISTIGSIFGSVITAFFVIDWLASIVETVIFVSIIAFATAVAIMLVASPDPRVSLRRYGILSLAGAILVILTTTAVVSSSRIDPSFGSAVGWRVLYAGDSPYHHVVVREKPGYVRELVFDVGVQSRMIIGDSFGPGSPYTDAFHLAPLIRPTIRRVLIIGLGGGTAVKQFTHAYPDVTVDVVEIDPLVIDLAKRFFRVQANERLHLHLADARAFLKGSRERWDLIIMDAYTSNRYGDTIPPHLVTREYFEEVAAHLTDGGVLHFHCTFARSMLLLALEKTAMSVFPSVLVSNGEILASKVALITSQEAIAQRAKNSAMSRLPNLSAYIAALRPPGAVARDVPLLTDDYAPVDLLAAKGADTSNH
ncbi:MAG TPA: fused MFS/spermidine synthase [Thermoanaerobaculia bacterium]|jgi:spermidine synthase